MAVESFESNAKREAVEAVERRWKRADAERRRIARRRKLSNFLASALLVLIAVIGGRFAADHFGVRIPFLSDFDWREIKFPGMHVTATADEIAFRDEFVRVFGLFKVSALSLWRDAPNEIKPKNAAKGVVYHALIVDDDNRASLFKMTANGEGMVTVERLSPLTKPATVSFAGFKELCADSPYFIACQGSVYFCGKGGVDVGRAALDRAFSAAGMTPGNP